jgi:hypothetical protein
MSKEVERVIQRWHDGGVMNISYRLAGTYNYHREDGPAMIGYHPNGLVREKGWFIDGVGCREDGPAYIKFTLEGNPSFVGWSTKNSKGYIHRIDGPARFKSGVWDWFLYGIPCTKYWHGQMVELANRIRGSRDLAIMNCKHNSEYIRGVCQEVLNGS